VLLLAIMAVVHMPASSLMPMPLSLRLSAMTPRIIDRTVGGMLELMIDLVEGVRDRRARLSR
jgi:hypothetical protein